MLPRRGRWNATRQRLRRTGYEGIMQLEKTEPERTSLRLTVAKAVSAIIHPVVFPLVTLAAITYIRSGSVRMAAVVTGLAVALTAAPVALLVGVQVARGKWTDLDVSVRQQRYALYPLGLIGATLMTVAFVLAGAPRAVIGAALALALANAIDGVINFSYKVSAHATAAAACAALVWLFVPGWGIVATVAAGLVGWSRVALGRHTTGQVLLGWLVGAACALGTQALFLS